MLVSSVSAHPNLSAIVLRGPLNKQISHVWTLRAVPTAICAPILGNPAPLILLSLLLAASSSLLEH